jgi:hypothetical protein
MTAVEERQQRIPGKPGRRMPAPVTGMEPGKRSHKYTQSCKRLHPDDISELAPMSRKIENGLPRRGNKMAELYKRQLEHAFTVQ